jgi:hypothetical protein
MVIMENNNILKSGKGAIKNSKIAAYSKIFIPNSEYF